MVIQKISFKVTEKQYNAGYKWLTKHLTKTKNKIAHSIYIPGNRKYFSSGNILWYTTYLQDIYLYNKCPLKFVKEYLQDKYKLEIKKGTFLGTHKDLNLNEQSFIWRIGKDLYLGKSRSDKKIKLHTKMYVVGEPNFFDFINKGYDVLQKNKYHSFYHEIEFVMLGIHLLRTKHGIVKTVEGKTIAKLPYLTDEILYKPKFKYCTSIKKLNSLDMDKVIVSTKQEFYDLSMVKNPYKLPNSNLATRMLPDYFKNFILK